MSAITSPMPVSSNAADVVSAAGLGRADALAELYARHGRSLMALAYRLTGSREVEGYSYAEIAELLDISANAATVRLHRALHTLRRQLGAGTDV